jgi:hypothetical protein
LRSLLLVLIIPSLLAILLLSGKPVSGQPVSGNIKKIEASLTGRALPLQPSPSCHSGVANRMINLLVTSDRNFDLVLNPSVLEEFKKKLDWIELLLKDPVSLTIGSNKQHRSITKILVCFKDERPRYIIYGSPNYEPFNVVANTQAGPELFQQIESCLLK